MLTYATETDYVNHTQEYGPDNLAALLRAASRLVQRATRGCIYDVEPSGMPSDPAIREAFRDATCEQAAAWAALGIDPAAGPAGVTGKVVASTSVGKASVSYAGAAEAASLVAASLTALTPDAAWYLESAGLTRVVTAW